MGLRCLDQIFQVAPHDRPPVPELASHRGSVPVLQSAEVTQPGSFTFKLHFPKSDLAVDVPVTLNPGGIIHHGPGDGGYEPPSA